MNKRNIISRAIIAFIQMSTLFSISTHTQAIIVEFNSLQNYSSFSFEGKDANGDGYLVYDEVSKLTPSISNIIELGDNTYEYYGWGVFDLANARFLNDTFSAWDVPTRPKSYATEEEFVQYIYASLWGSSSNYTIEQMSMRPEPGGISRIVFDGINGIGFSYFYSANVVNIPSPNTLGLIFSGILGFVSFTFTNLKKYISS